MIFSLNNHTKSLIIPQVRCNLFHGGKNPENQTEKYVIEKAVPALKKFLEELFYSSEILERHPQLCKA